MNKGVTEQRESETGVGWGRRGDSGSAHCVETLQGQAAGCFHSPNSNSGPVQGRPAASGQARGPVRPRGVPFIGFQRSSRAGFKQRRKERWSVGWDGAVPVGSRLLRTSASQRVCAGENVSDTPRLTHPQGLVALLSRSAWPPAI